MQKFKPTLAAFLAACAMLNLTGCSENSGSNTSDMTIGNPDAPNNGGADIKESGGAEVSKLLQYAPITLSDNNTVNSIRLFDAIIADNENAMFSPISLNLALGLIESGAEGETKAALDSYLQTENIADFAQNYMKLAREQYTFDGDSEQKNVLEIANSLWADNALPLKDDYKKAVAEKFEAEIENLDFTDKKKTLDAINGWVSDKTHKMIPSVLSDYGAETVAVLVNTVYFESAWSDKWSINEDNKESFTLPDGTTKEIPLMYNGGDSYYENDKATAFGCKYKNGLEFIGILPKESGEFTLDSLDIPALLESKSFDYDVSAVMPRLNFETAFPLKEPLGVAGLDNIFDPEKADFSGMSDAPLYVSDILQKTKLELDENGTKAAAVTVITTDGCEAVMPEPKEQKTVRLDRQFAFMIYDAQEQQILFVGKVTNP